MPTILIPSKVSVEEVGKNTRNFILQPLSRGYGITVGNALRRVLLTSVPGAAITSIKIDGVLHEFSTIKGVVEDVSEIILNLKQVRLKLFEPRPDKVTLGFKGATEFTAGMIGANNTQFTILNPDLHIATLGDDADFSMEIKISAGIGYATADENKQNQEYTIGTIFLDSDFSPVTKVSYEIENLPTKAAEIQEKLILTVTTDGSISPEGAVSYAAKTLGDFMGLFKIEESEAIEVPQEKVDDDILQIRNLLTKSIEEMELTVRSHNCLKAANINTIADLVSRNESEMLNFKNFGRKSLSELQEKLSQMGLTFGMDVEKYLKEESE